MNIRCFRLLVFLPILLASACGSPAGNGLEGEVTGATTDELVGGTQAAEYVRPEIGRYVDRGGGAWGCTATLVASRYVLTAAHCLTPTFTGTTPSAVDKVQLSSATTLTPTTYTVSRIQSFSYLAQAAEFTGASPGLVTDLAVLKLANAVPTRDAKPMAIAAEAPRPGTAATLWGYGCTDRTQLSTSGFKQSFPFTTTWPPSTTAICPGDSGGPVISNLQGRDGIWGVNSGYNTVSGLDRYADVSYYKYQIELLMRQWDASTLQPGFDRPGLDARVISMTTPSEIGCLGECQKDIYCRAFSYEKPVGTGKAKCHLKSGIPDWVPSEGFTSGVPLHRELSSERPGASYRDFDLTAAQPELCTAECMRDKRCAAYTYAPPASSTTTAKAHCWLKETAVAQVAHTTRQSGQKRAFENNVDRTATVATDDYSTMDALSAETCRVACASDDQCRAFTYVPAGNEGLTTAQCRFKREWLEGKAAPGYISAVKRGLEVNTDRAGGSYLTFTPADPRPEICQARCAGDALCQSWTYLPTNSPGVTAATGMCALKGTVRTKVTMNKRGFVSGLKGGDFFGGEERL